LIGDGRATPNWSLVLFGGLSGESKHVPSFSTSGHVTETLCS
jgi:hypothetical protein